MPRCCASAQARTGASPMRWASMRRAGSLRCASRCRSQSKRPSTRDTSSWCSVRMWRARCRCLCARTDECWELWRGAAPSSTRRWCTGARSNTSRSRRGRWHAEIRGAACPVASTWETRLLVPTLPCPSISSPGRAAPKRACAMRARCWGSRAIARWSVRLALRVRRRRTFPSMTNDGMSRHRLPSCCSRSQRCSGQRVRCTACTPMPR